MSFQYLGHDLKAEGVASILDLKQLTLSNAASDVNDAVRLQEFTSEIDNIQSQVDAISGDQTRISHVHVDETSADLATALAAGSYDGVNHQWTFGSTVIGVGDVIILQAAADPKDRTWIHNGGEAGSVADFSHLNSDVEALVNAGVQSVLDALRAGVPEAGDTLDKLYTLILSVQTAVDGHTVRLDAIDVAIDNLEAEVATKADAFHAAVTFAPHASLVGVYECVVANPVGSHRVTVTLDQEVGGGVYAELDKTAYELLKSDAELTFRTMIPAMNGQAYEAIIEG